nr:hypothetical protein DMOBY_06040 [Dehalococcoides mccartyi]
MELQIGSTVQTPRFCTVKISALFNNVQTANECGFTEPTHFRDEDYFIWGKSLGNNRMIFAGIKRYE